MSGKTIAVTGATGMVGGVALRLLLEDERVSAVSTFGRRATGVTHDKLTDHSGVDFDDLSSIADELAGHDAVLFCLGAYAGTVPDELFKKITVDYAVDFGRLLLERSPEAVYVLLSGQGADQSGKSRIPFARYKGMAESQLQEMGFSRLHILRPGYIYPVEARQEPNILYRGFRSIYPIIRPIAPDNFHVTSEELAGVMVRAALEGTGAHTEPVLENRDIRKLIVP